VQWIETCFSPDVGFKAWCLIKWLRKWEIIQPSRLRLVKKTKCDPKICQLEADTLPPFLVLQKQVLSDFCFFIRTGFSMKIFSLCNRNDGQVSVYVWTLQARLKSIVRVISLQIHWISSNLVSFCLFLPKYQRKSGPGLTALVLHLNYRFSK